MIANLICAVLINLVLLHVYEDNCCVLPTTEPPCKHRHKRDSDGTMEEDDSGDSIERGVAFMQRVNHYQLIMANEYHLASFAYLTNITEYNLNIVNKRRYTKYSFLEEHKKLAKEFDWRSFKHRNATLYRWFNLFIGLPSQEDSEDIEGMFTSRREKNMGDIFNEARVCPFGTPENNMKNCTLQLEPELDSIMQQSENPKELEYIWEQFRNVTGGRMRNAFWKHVNDFNSYASINVQIQEYESDDFLDNIAKCLKDILPLYKNLHAYVRRKLSEYYRDVEILEDGPIPAHLFGDMYAQFWRIFPIVNPYPDINYPNLTRSMLEKKMTPLDIFVMAENFFVSIGMERMTPYFWAKSMIEKPKDREVVCHASAHDFYDGKDFRIKMCTDMEEQDFRTVHHEMGHIVYDMSYRHQPRTFMEGANPGFHEAVGDSVALSAMTIDYLKKMNLFPKDLEENKEMDIVHLLKQALSLIPTAPYAYILDQYRWQIYNGSVTDENLNRAWWELRLKYQGVCPPVERTERDFDAGAKYHIAYGVEFTRYFFANIFEFQIHKALCDAANYQGPLHKCSIYKNKAAGKLFRKVLRPGKSRHWKEVMRILTGHTTQLSAEPFLEYFRPLEKWLKKQNRNKPVGWKSSNPMVCPTANEKKQPAEKHMRYL